MKSQLQHHPKSKISENGYINVYSTLTPQEKRQLNYKRRYKEDIPTWDESLVWLSNYFSNLVTQDVSVLDAGCGNGNYVIDENRTKISWAVGVDIDKDFTKKNVCLDEIRISNLEELPFESNTFDIVLSLWVLEHLENPAKVFDEIQRVLKPGGLFLFVTPNSNYLPLKLIHLVKSVKANQFLNRYLFGRKSADIFPAFYKANSLELLNELLPRYFKVKELHLNSDPSYTSFGEISYYVTKLLLRLGFLQGYLYSHILGVVTKK